MPSRKTFDDKPPRNPKPVESWRVIQKSAAYGDPLKVLRIEVRYLSGNARTLAVSFRNRAELDNYVNRFHPEFSGKEEFAAD
jgi:hypothetical protein